MKKLIKSNTSDLRGKEYIECLKQGIKVFAKYFDKQVQDYIDYIENNPQMFVTVQTMTKMSDEEFNNITEEIELFLANSFIAGQNFSEKEIQKEITIGLSFDIKFEYALEWAKANSGKLIRGINETTQSEISDIIAKSIEEGKTIKETTKIIQEKFIQYSQYRAALISTMETSNAFGEGKWEQFNTYQNSFGKEGWKRSQTQGDDNVRPTHVANASEGRIPANQEFKATQTLHEPHGFNCRCVVSYRLTKPEN